jgi:hypothetical protein
MSLVRSVRRFTVPTLTSFFQVGGVIDDLIHWLGKIIYGHDIRIEKSHQYFTATVSTAATTDIISDFSQDQRHKITVGVGGGAYEHTFDLFASNFQAGDKVSFFFACPSSTNPTITITDDASGAELYSYNISGTGNNFVIEVMFDGTNWFIYNIKPEITRSWAEIDF